MPDVAITASTTSSIRPVELGPITQLSEQPTEPYGPLDLSWLDAATVSNDMPRAEYAPFDTQKPPEGIEFSALLNETEQLLPYYISGLKGNAVPGDVSGKIIGVQDRLSTLLVKSDPFEECMDLKEAFKMLFIMREVELASPVNGALTVPGYKAVLMYRAGKSDMLPSNIVNGINRLRDLNVTTIAPQT